MSFASDFKAFINKGNVVDLAVAVVIGGAFGKIVTSFVNDIIMPPIGLLLGKVDFSQLYIALNGTHYDTLDAAKKAGAPILSYGVFINTIINFIIVALAVFMVVRAVSKLQKAPAPADPTTKECPFCISSIPLAATRCPSCTSQLNA